jgi:hypothetical protein
LEWWDAYAEGAAGEIGVKEIRKENKNKEKKMK